MMMVYTRVVSSLDNNLGRNHFFESYKLPKNSLRNILLFWHFLNFERPVTDNILSDNILTESISARVSVLINLQA